MIRTPPLALALLQGYEELRLKPYRDQAGHWTVGIGHKIREDEQHLMQGVTRLQAADLFLEDVKRFEDVVARCEPRGKQLPPNKFGALLLLAYNIGASAFWSSTLYRVYLKPWKWLGQEEKAGDEFLRWDKVTVGGEKVVSKGLAARRAEERELWLREE